MLLADWWPIHFGYIFFEEIIKYIGEEVVVSLLFRNDLEGNCYSSFHKQQWSMAWHRLQGMRDIFSSKKRIYWWLYKAIVRSLKFDMVLFVLVFTCREAARSSRGFSLLFFFLLARHLVKNGKFGFLVHGSFILCLSYVILRHFVNFTLRISINLYYFLYNLHKFSRISLIFVKLY